MRNREMTAVNDLEKALFNISTPEMCIAGDTYAANAHCRLNYRSIWAAVGNLESFTHLPPGLPAGYHAF
jgi:hypothetical protein